MITLHFIYNRSTNMNYFVYISQFQPRWVKALETRLQEFFTPTFIMINTSTILKQAPSSARLLHLLLRTASRNQRRIKQ